MPSFTDPVVGSSSKRVLISVEDVGLGELLADALRDASHCPFLVDNGASFDVAIVDLDTRARRGSFIIAGLRARIPEITVIALLPCGGLRNPDAGDWHFALEKPARLQSVLSAVSAARTVPRN